MQDPKENKVLKPASNKAELVNASVKIQMRQGRAFEGVTTDANGFAFVDEQTAAHLVKINYAIMAEEK